jgi:hypothetical protein
MKYAHHKNIIRAAQSLARSKAETKSGAQKALKKWLQNVTPVWERPHYTAITTREEYKLMSWKKRIEDHGDKLLRLRGLPERNYDTDTIRHTNKLTKEQALKLQRYAINSIPENAQYPFFVGSLGKEMNAAAREAGLVVDNPLGEFNGYGYDRLPLAVVVIDDDQLNIVKKIHAETAEKMAKRKPAKRRTPEQKIESWCKRLAKFTDITIGEAHEIANAKIEYAMDRLYAASEVEIRGWTIPKWRREAEKKYNRACDNSSILLDRISDAAHAYAILTANRRHTQSNYETKLGEAKELKNYGIIDRDEVQQYARDNMEFKNSSAAL